MFLITFPFFVFLALTIAVYYVIPGKYQWMILLIASGIFYMLAGSSYTVIYLLISVVSVWWGTNQIEKIRNDKVKAARILKITLFINIFILAALKYTNFLLRNIKMAGRVVGADTLAGIPLVHWAASLGLSFYTLQMLGYLLDVYWGTSKPQKNLGKVALFASYFPQMSSGPISRYHELENQLYEPHRFEYKRICAGLQRMLIGLVKKLVLAENLNIYVSYIFDDNANFNGWFIWIGMAAYLVQLYADFSGCMDIVLGVSECFGIYLPENFNRPFHSKSIQEFWKRWHITLGAWAQDYIMYPLLRSKTWNNMRKWSKKKFGKEASKRIPAFTAMFLLWLFMGLWHGGQWNYVTEMIWFWVVIITGQLFDKQLKEMMKKLHINGDSVWWGYFQSARTALIFGMGVTLFQASSLKRGLHYLKSGFTPKCLTIANFKSQLAVYLGLFSKEEGLKSLVCILFGLLVMFVVVIFKAKEKSFREWLSGIPLVIRWIILYTLLFGVIFFGVYGPGFNASEFIYGGF